MQIRAITIGTQFALTVWKSNFSSVIKCAPILNKSDLG